jgi:hypothetical protein
MDDRLVKTVTPSRGQPYVHRCTRRVFEAVCYALEARPTEGATMESLADALDAPYTQVNVALEFLKDRGCVETRLRRSYPASNVLFEDAMTEFFALAAGE